MSIPLLLIRNFSELYCESKESALYKRDHYLYKHFKKGCFKRGYILNQIKYNYEISREVSNKIILPNKLIDIDTYRMNFVEGFNIDECLDINIPLERRIEILNALFEALKEAHQFLIVGDIMARNCIVPKDIFDKNGYLIDFDLASKATSNEAFSTYSLRKKDARLTLSTKDTDIIKLFIVSLNLLFQVDIERTIIFKPRLEIIREFLEKTLQNDGFLLDYFNYLENAFENNTSISEYLHINNTSSFITEVEKGTQRIRNI